MTEAFADVEMPVASKKRASLRCKVDTGAGGNVMPLRAFGKLFPQLVDKEWTAHRTTQMQHKAQSLQRDQHSTTWCPRHNYILEGRGNQ